MGEQEVHCPGSFTCTIEMPCLRCKHPYCTNGKKIKGWKSWKPIHTLVGLKNEPNFIISGRKNSGKNYQ